MNNALSDFSLITDLGRAVLKLFVNMCRVSCTNETDRYFLYLSFGNLTYESSTQPMKLTSYQPAILK